MHVHMLWWLRIDGKAVPDNFKVHIPPEVEREFHLVVVNEEDNTVKERLYDQDLLDYTNANVWAIQDWFSMEDRLANIVSPLEREAIERHRKEQEEEHNSAVPPEVAQVLDDIGGLDDGPFWDDSVHDGRRSFRLGVRGSALANTEPSGVVADEKIDAEHISERLARQVCDFQTHTCKRGSCLTRRLTAAECRKRGLLYPKTEAEWRNMSERQAAAYYVCKKRFPKPVRDEERLRAHAIVNFDKSTLYEPPRDHGRVNNYHPMLMHLWGSNMDIQILHKCKSNVPSSLLFLVCYAIAVYITSYLSKLDKAENANYRLILQDLVRQLKRVASGELDGVKGVACCV